MRKAGCQDVGGGAEDRMWEHSCVTISQSLPSGGTSLLGCGGLRRVSHECWRGWEGPPGNPVCGCLLKDEVIHASSPVKGTERMEGIT